MRHPGGVQQNSGSRAAVTALWVLFALVAVTSGWLAVRMVGGAITPAAVPVLSPADVSKRLATASAAATGEAQPTRSARPSRTPTSAEPAQKTVVRTLSSPGGSVLAACANGLVTLRSVSPAVGFRVDELEEGADAEVEVRFVSSASEVKLKVECVDGVPRAESEVDDESGDDD
jgi:hypothetical protein